MIHVYTGKNKSNYIDTFKKKHTGQNIYIDAGMTEKDQLFLQLSSVSLFGDTQNMIITGLLGTYGSAVFLEALDLVRMSSNSHLFLEDKILKKERDFLAALSATIVEEKEEREVKDNRIYTAIQTRNKKNAFIALEYLFTIDTPEYAHGAIYTAFKNMLEASENKKRGKTYTEAGFKEEWLYNKAISSSSLYKEEELHSNVLELARMLQDSHGENAAPLALQLEKFVLEKI